MPGLADRGCREGEAVEIAQLEEEDVPEQLDDAAMEQGNRHAVEPPGRRRCAGSYRVHVDLSRAYWTRAAARYMPCTNLPYGSVRKRASTRPRWTTSRAPIAGPSRNARSSSPVRLVMKRSAMNETSSCDSPGASRAGSRLCRQTSRPEGPISRPRPPAVPSTTGRL